MTGTSFRTLAAASAALGSAGAAQAHEAGGSLHSHLVEALVVLGLIAIAWPAVRRLIVSRRRRD